MIFEINPSQIECLGSQRLVMLLRKLLHAEVQRTGISLSGISVPLQITIPDGGEDARISWEGGVEKTDYLPSRFCIFQSKATDPGPGGWKKEVWTKYSQKKSTTRQLSAAVQKVISEKGAYIGFTSAAVVGEKFDRRVDGIRQGLAEAGADPDQLAKIDIYDANKIAEWASRYPAVAVWLNEVQSGLHLRNFQTIVSLGKKADIVSIQNVDDKKERYYIGDENIIGQAEREPATNVLSFQQIKERIGEHLLNAGGTVRIIGPSGVGKTRFIYEVFRDETTLAKILLSTSAIYCDFREIGQNVFQIAQSLTESGSFALMIVDECQRDAAQKLYEIAAKAGSMLKVITIGINDLPIKFNKCFNIAVGRADDALVEGIIRQRIPKADEADVSFIKNLSGGFPRIAVIATDNYSENVSILKSIDDVVERILDGCNINHPDQVRAIECLALFSRLGADEELSDQLEIVAKTFARQTVDEMYEHLAQASKHTLVDRRGRYFTLQLLPIAAFLGTRRMDLLRVKTILQFIETAPQELVTSFFAQWRHFGTSETAITVSERLLSRDGKLATLDALNTEYGARCLNELVHVNPDTVADTIKQVFFPLSIDELGEIREGRRNLIWALEKLVFRNSSFPVAARLLMRLAAAENENIGNNATGQFKELFQLELSGTEAEPPDRFAVLDEGIGSDDERLISVCIDALESTLNRGHFSRSGGAEQIGIQPPLKDWRPKLWSEIFNFHRSGLQRLDNIRSKYPQFAGRCEQIIATNIRMLLCENLFGDIEGIIRKIATEKGIWLEAIGGVGDWLYFDRKGAPHDLSIKIRRLYDSLIPTDLVQKALFYTKFWAADIRDPDMDYDSDDSRTLDFEYSSRNAIEVATVIAKDKTLVDRAIRTMAAEDLNSAFPFAQELALKVDDPIEAFEMAVDVYKKSVDKGNMQFISGMLAGIDKRDKEKADVCIKIALDSGAFKNQTINIYTAVEVSGARLLEIIQKLKAGSLSAADCVLLSYGRVLYNLNAEDILPLIDELAENHESDGLWTAIQIIFMYQYGRKDLDQQIAERLMQYVTSPKLLGKMRKGSREGYQFEQVVQLIHKHCSISDEFAIGISKQLTRLCQVDDYSIFSALDEPARKIIKLLVKEKPSQLWDVITRFFEIATPLEIHRLERLIGPSRHGSDDDYHHGGGALFGIPESERINWAKADPVKRTPFLCYFYPLFDTSTQHDHEWHPSLEHLTHEFGSVEEFRQALARRFYPHSWSGSILPHLKVYLKPLGTWFTHSVPEMALWARNMYHSLEKQIKSERSREDEDHYQ